MSRSFIIEAVMLAIHGDLCVPEEPVDFIIPYTTIMELYEMLEGSDAIMPTPEEDEHVKKKIAELIAFFEDSLNKKKIEKALQMTWRKSPPLPINDRVKLTIINAMENAEFGEEFDPIETVLMLTASREYCPLLTDQLDFLEKIVKSQINIEVIDVEDFEFAVDGEFLV